MATGSLKVPQEHFDTGRVLFEQQRLAIIKARELKNFGKSKRDKKNKNGK